MTPRRLPLFLSAAGLLVAAALTLFTCTSTYSDEDIERRPAISGGDAIVSADFHQIEEARFKLPGGWHLVEDATSDDWLFLPGHPKSGHTAMFWVGYLEDDDFDSYREDVRDALLRDMRGHWNSMEALTVDAFAPYQTENMIPLLLEPESDNRWLIRVRQGSLEWKGWAFYTLGYQDPRGVWGMPIIHAEAHIWERGRRFVFMMQTDDVEVFEDFYAKVWVDAIASFTSIREVGLDHVED